MIRKLALILNWSLLSIIAIGICLEIFIPMIADENGTIGIIGGKNGPTAVWITSEMNMTSYVQLIFLIIMPVINIVALMKTKEK